VLGIDIHQDSPVVKSAQLSDEQVASLRPEENTSVDEKRQLKSRLLAA
jgi:hypothetical protein